jgi:hypothetical protein
MNMKLLAGAAALAATFTCLPTAAHAGPPSAYLRCDGLPNNVSGAETAGRVLAAAALVGLFLPQNETPNIAERRRGAEGVAACSEVLVAEGNEVRRAQLLLARAIHHIEANAYDDAIADARAVATDRPEFAATQAFRLSFGLSAMEVEALALAGKGRHREAADKAMEMAAAAPYDLLANLRAARFVAATGAYGEAERRYYDNLVRLYPLALADRAAARQHAGDWSGAADDYELLERIYTSMSDRRVPTILAHAALARGLAGDAQAADALGRAAQEAIDAENASDRNTNLTGAREVVDLFRILRTAQSGNAENARLLFAARSGWEIPNSAAVSRVAAVLREGAAEAQLTGLLAGDPARFRSEALATRARNIHGDTAAKEYFRAIRDWSGQRAFSRFGGNVWREGRSRYFAREENKDTRARFVTVMRDGGGTPGHYALLLHSALVARAEGRRNFMLLPAQSALFAAFVRTGNPGDERMFDAVSFDTERVIADLSPIIPRPTPAARGGGTAKARP